MSKKWCHKFHLKVGISVKLSEKHIVHTELYMHESKHVW